MSNIKRNVAKGLDKEKPRPRPSEEFKKGKAENENPSPEEQKISSPEPSPDEKAKPVKKKAKGKKKKGKKEKKKIDPEVLKQQFQAWKETDEYKKWAELCQIRKDYPEITETSDDLVGKWQFAEDKIMAFSKCFKVKTKMKELKHEHVRSFFFAREDKDNFQIDGVIAGVVKEHSDGAWHLRRKFIEIWNAFDEINDYNEETFQEARKKMSKNLTELLKGLGPHIKGCHKEIYYEKMDLILRPLSNLLKSNMRLSIFEQAYPNETARETVDFKYKALKDRFCLDFQEVLRVLHVVEKDPEKRLIASPDVRNIFKKLEMKDWEKSPIEFFYLSKLRHAFFKTRKHMVKLFVQGIDFWKIPLSANQQTLEDIKRLVDYELICERLIGDPLKRDQLNFAHQSLDLIMKTPGQDKMLSKENTFTQVAIPKLLIYKNLQRIRNVLDIEKQEKAKSEIEGIQGGVYFQFSVSKIQVPKEILEKAAAEDAMNMTDPRLRPKSAFVTSNMTGTGMRPKSALAKDFPMEESKELAKNFEKSAESKVGRMWVLENYVHEKTRSFFMEAAEDLRHINPTVQQDIEDTIITEGLNTSKDILEHREKYRDEIKKVREFLDHLKLEDNKKDEINSRRPPNLWNDPKTWETIHNYRSIAAPQECYKDNRIQSLMDKVEYLAQHLLDYQTPWINDLISRTIDVFKDEFIPKPDPLGVYLGSIV